MTSAPELLPYQRIRDDLFRPLAGISGRYIVVALAALSVVVTGLAAWVYQLNRGMDVTRLQRPVF